MVNIDFEIKSRGSMRIRYGVRFVTISGELTFEPPVFYADLSSFKAWDYPYENDAIKDEEIDEIVHYITHYKGPTLVKFE